MDNEKKQILANEARLLAHQPARLLNVIFRNIKEEAEMGRQAYDYTSPMSEETEMYVCGVIRARGYEVTSAFHYEDWLASYDTKKEIRIVSLIITW